MKKLLPLFILIFSLVASAQELSTDWQKVPTIFQGNDFYKIYTTILSSPVLKEKSEFETTAQYNERVNDVSKISFGANSNATTGLVFVNKPIETATYFSGLSSKYNADNEVLSIEIELHKTEKLSMGNGKIERYPFLAAKTNPSKIEIKGEYVGSNAYGTKATIRKTEITNFSFAIRNIKEFDGVGSNSYSPKFELSLKMSVERAKQAKENLATLFVVKLAPPFYDISSFDVKPTIDKPREIHSTDLILIGDVSEIWLFNGSSGEIYSKLKAKSK